MVSRVGMSRVMIRDKPVGRENVQNKAREGNAFARIRTHASVPLCAAQVSQASQALQQRSAGSQNCRMRSASAARSIARARRAAFRGRQAGGRAAGVWSASVGPEGMCKPDRSASRGARACPRVR